MLAVRLGNSEKQLLKTSDSVALVHRAADSEAVQEWMHFHS